MSVLKIERATPKLSAYDLIGRFWELDRRAVEEKSPNSRFGEAKKMVVYALELRATRGDSTARELLDTYVEQSWPDLGGLNPKQYRQMQFAA